MKYLRVLPAFKILPEKSRILYWRFLPSGRVKSCLLTFLFPLIFGLRRSKVQRCNPIPPCSSPKNICPLILELIENTFNTWLWEQNEKTTGMSLELDITPNVLKHLIQCFWPVCVTLECHFFSQKSIYGVVLREEKWLFISQVVRLPQIIPSCYTERMLWDKWKRKWKGEMINM